MKTLSSVARQSASIGSVTVISSLLMLTHLGGILFLHLRTLAERARERERERDRERERERERDRGFVDHLSCQLSLSESLNSQAFQEPPDKDIVLSTNICQACTVVADGWSVQDLSVSTLLRHSSIPRSHLRGDRTRIPEN